MHVMRSFNPTFVPEDHSTFNEIYPVNSGVKNIVSVQPFKFTLACSNCQGKCLRILRKSITTLAKKLPKLALYGTKILYFNLMIFQSEHLSLVEKNPNFEA